MTTITHTATTVEALQMDALRTVFRWTPWGRDKISRAVARYLDGNDRALDKLPLIRAQLVEASLIPIGLELLEGLPD